MLSVLVGRLRLITFAVLLTLATEGGIAQQTVLPAVGEVSDKFWTPPWVLDQRGSPLRALHNAMQQTRNGPLEIHLDDGSRGMLRVESRPCATGDDCEPFDCGCPLEYESYWAEVVNSHGEAVARLHLWAAYGVFDIVPVDLVDGPGDELIIIRIPAHSSPPAGYDLKVWKLGRSKPIELIEPIRVAGLFDSRPIGCARWRTHLVVDVTSAKPRAVALRTDFAIISDGSSTAVCRIDDAEVERHASLKRGDVLRFEGGQYRRH